LREAEVTDREDIAAQATGMALHPMADRAAAMTDSPFFHEGAREVRFSVIVDQASVWASIGQATLRYHFHPTAHEDDPMKTFMAHEIEIKAAVRRRVAAGSLQPVMLRESDLR
jgi:hypothetical protein